MSRKTIVAALAATGIALGVVAQEAVPQEGTAPVEQPAAVDAQAVAETIEQDGDESLVAVEAGVNFDSRYMTYGVIDGKDPIVTPEAKVTFADWVYMGVSAIFDTTKGNGKRGGYGNRAGKYTTLDMTAGIAHKFELPDELGTLSVDFNYIYEYIPRHHGSMDDTQYLNLELGLGGHWIEPTLLIERDLMADDGTYVNLNLAHTFPLIGDDKDPVLTFKPSVAQGFGDKKRTRGYELAESHEGLMDTTLKGEFEWKVCDNVKLSAYVAYYDYWFDRSLRHGARAYNRAWGSGCKDSWNIVAGIGASVEF